MKFTAEAIAEFLKGEIEGDPKVEVNDVSKIEEGKEGTLSFLANPKYYDYIYSTESSIVLINKTFVPSKKVNATLIKVDDAYKSFSSLLQLYESSKPKKTGIHKTAVIDASAKIGKNVYIGAYAVIEQNAKIEDNTEIYPHCFIDNNTIIGEGSKLFSGVKVYDTCKIGRSCIIHSGSVIGSDGFGFAPNSGDYEKIPQIGNVIIEDNVEIGSNVSIDRATMGSTIIRKGVKIDNLCQIAHNVEIGENCVMSSQFGVAGSTKIGKNCMFGGQVGIVNHAKIADNTKAAAQSGIASSIKEEGKVVFGSPAIDARDFQKSFIVFKTLPELRKKVSELEKELNNLKNK